MTPIDETLLTSYALGELDKRARAEVELYIASHPEAAAFIHETREFSLTLRAEYEKSAAATPPDGQSAWNRIAAPSGPVPRIQVLRIAGLLAAAVVLSIGIYGLGTGFGSPKERGSLLLNNTPPPASEARNMAGAGDLGTAAKERNIEFRNHSAGDIDLDVQGADFSGFTLEQDSQATLLWKNAETLKTSGGANSDGSPQPENFVGVLGAGTPPQALFTIQMNDGRGAVNTQPKDVVKYSRNSVLSSADEGKIKEELARRSGDLGFENQTFAFADHDDMSVQERERTRNESYQQIVENPFRRISDDPLSTFSIDVDTASYANIRRFLNRRSLPPKDSVRIEEMINYFSYSDPAPRDGRPFQVRLESAVCPWNTTNRLVRIGVKGKEILRGDRKGTNLVFLVDVSGSMASQEKLPLVKEGLRLLVQELTENDQVAIVTYAGHSGVALPSTNAATKNTILAAIDALQPGGSTNGASGISLAYDMAVSHFIRDGVNRVVLMTDGDFNVGITDRAELGKLITDRAKSGVFLSVLGYGMGNLKDATMEMLADRGNGHYAYIDSLREARKVLVDEMNATFVTIAKDVKIQVEFNPATVSAARLIGYENRVLQHSDFNDDRKDAGEIGAGHTVTALYEIVPVGASAATPGVEPLKYQSAVRSESELRGDSGELLTVKIRYKEPEGETSKLLEFPLVNAPATFTSASEDLRFAACVASFGMLLRDSAYRGTANWNTVLELAEESLGADPYGYRREFVELVRKARDLMSGGQDRR